MAKAKRTRAPRGETVEATLGPHGHQTKVTLRVTGGTLALTPQERAEIGAMLRCRPIRLWLEWQRCDDRLPTDGPSYSLFAEDAPRDAPEFTETPSRRWLRSSEQALAAWEQACRQRWRALALIVKAKLEAVQAGITTFEDEFLAETLLPSGATVGRWLQPQIEAAYQAGKMPELLAPLSVPEYRP